MYAIILCKYINILAFCLYEELNQIDTSFLAFQYGTTFSSIHKCGPVEVSISTKCAFLCPKQMFM